MGLWAGAKKVVGHMVDVRVDQWLDLVSLKQSTYYLWDQTKSLFKIKAAPEHAESFKEAVDRMALSEEVIAKQSQSFRKLAFFFVLMALALVIYAIVVYRLNNRIGTIISLSLSLYALSLAFRFHFWHLQIAQKKLGLNIREYYRSLLPIKRKDHL